MAVAIHALFFYIRSNEKIDLRNQENIGRHWDFLLRTVNYVTLIVDE